MHAGRQDETEEERTAVSMVEELVRVWPHSRLGRALLLSAIVHASAAVFVPSLRIAPPEPDPLPTLEVRLAPPPAPLAAPSTPQPVRADAPVQARAEPAPPKPRSKPTPVLARTEPARTDATPPAPVVPARPADPEPAAAPAQVAHEPPASAAPAERTAVAEAASTDMLFGFGQMLEQALESNQHYPRLARQRGWQGLVKMRVQFLPGGQIGQISIVRSSGFAMLDETAVAMLRSAELPPVPDGLRRREFQLDVPVEFRLKS
jgi:protein TonB